MSRNVKVQCRAKTRTCRKCEYRYTKADRELKNCPTCGEERQCQQAALTGYPTCRAHGAGSPLKGRPGGRPPKDGIFRHLLPERMLAAYDQAYEDIRLTELRRDIALMETRRADLIKKTEVGESSKLWTEVVKNWKEYRRAKRAGYESAEYYLNLESELDRLISRGYNDMVAWREVDRVTNELRKLKVDETRRLKEMQQMISTEKLMALIGKVVQVIERVVQEREQRTAIAIGIKSLLEGSYIEGEWEEVEQ